MRTNVCMHCVHAQSLSLVWLFATPWNVAHQAPLSMGFSRQEHWLRLPFPTQGDFPDSETEPTSPMSPDWQTDSLPLCHLGSPMKTNISYLFTVCYSKEVSQHHLHLTDLEAARGTLKFYNKREGKVHSDWRILFFYVNGFWKYIWHSLVQLSLPCQKNFWTIEYQLWCQKFYQVLIKYSEEGKGTSREDTAWLEIETSSRTSI